MNDDAEAPGTLEKAVRYLTGAHQFLMAQADEDLNENADSDRREAAEDIELALVILIGLSAPTEKAKDTQLHKTLAVALGGMKRITRAWDEYDRAMIEAQKHEGEKRVPYPNHYLFGSAMLCLNAYEKYILALEQSLGVDHFSKAIEEQAAHFKQPAPVKGE